MTEEEAGRLLRMEDEIHKRLINQKSAVSSVARAIRRARSGLKDPRRPVGSFLFLGPTGVGKTELGRALAEFLFGSEEAMIRLDMSEYMERHEVAKLIGAPPGYVGHENGGKLTEAIRRRPYSVVLFDEVEKAHPDSFNILLQILEDGRLVDGQGHEVDFRNAVIILTSNVGAEHTMKGRSLGFSPQDAVEGDWARTEKHLLEDVKRTFRPEFLNRIDDILVFRPLNREDLLKIVATMMQDVSRRLKEKHILLSVSEDVQDHILNEGFDPKYGARPLRRTIQRLVEDPMSDMLLEGSIRAGDEVTLSMKDGKVFFGVASGKLLNSSFHAEEEKSEESQKAKKPAGTPEKNPFPSEE
jgi:ATP-dependent Clp protease ATP-binding subunit ClpC